MFWITEDAVIRCDHAGSGKVTGFSPAQSWVRVDHRRILVRPDPVGRTIQGCILKPPQAKPCTLTLQVTGGYSRWIRIDGKPVSLSAVVGLTEGFPQTQYRVHSAGQRLVGTDQ